MRKQTEFQNVLGRGSGSESSNAQEVVNLAPASITSGTSMTTMTTLAMLEHATANANARQLQLQQLQMQHEQAEQRHQQQQHLHQMNELSNQLGCVSPQHDRYILNTLQQFRIMQQQQGQHHMNMIGNGMAHQFAMNEAAREAQLELQQQEEERHQAQLALEMEKVCSKQNPPYPPPLIEVLQGACTVEERGITSNDVLAGRGNRVNNHAGNIRFRELVKPFKVQYLQKSTKKVTKAQMCAVLVSYVRTHFEPQGRFLEKDPKTRLWVEIGDEKARKKAGQALREDATVIRAELGIAKPGSKEDKDARAVPVKNEGKESLATHKESISVAPKDVAVDLEATRGEEGQDSDAPLAVNLPLEVDISHVIAARSSKRASNPAPVTSAFGDGTNVLVARSGSAPSTTSMAMAMAKSRSDSTSSMMSNATAVIGNLSNQSANLDVHCQVRVDANTIAAQEQSVLEEEEPDENETDLLLRQKKRLLMSQRKHRPSMTTTQAKVPSQRRLAVTSPQEEDIVPPLVDLRMLKREPSFKSEIPLAAGGCAEPDGECGTMTMAGRRLLMASAGKNPNASVPRLYVSSRTIHSVASQAEDMDGDNDSDNSIDLHSDQEERTSRLYSKTPSKHRLIVKHQASSNNLTMEDEDALKASAAASTSFGHQSGSSSGSSNNSYTNRRPSQASVSLRRGNGTHQRSSIRSRSSITGHGKQRRKSSICMNDLIQSIDNASKNGDQTKSMFDSSMTMSTIDHFGNISAMSSANWNTSHGNMSLADFSFTQVLHELADDDDSEDSDEEQRHKTATRPRTARRPAAAGTGGGNESCQASSASSMHQSQTTTHSLSMSMSCASMASHSSSSHSARAYL